MKDLSVGDRSTASGSVSEAVLSRASLRAFLPTPVSRDVIQQILLKAARAPSGTNMQPWFAHLLLGDTLAKVSKEVCTDYDNDVRYRSEEPYYPDQFFEPYKTRRRTVGWALYSLLGIEKGDKQKMKAQHRRNFEFFSAPVGLIFTTDRRLATGSWLDFGMFLQNVMLLAREAGLHSCPQAAFCGYHTAVRRALPLPENEIVVCGMSIGYADMDAIENSLVTERVPYNEFVTVYE